MTTQYQDTLLASVATRRAYEIAKNSENTSIIATLAKIEKRFTQVAVAALCETANLNADFLNRQERTSARFNVYSAEKVVSDVCYATMNHYSKAILRAAKALRDAKLVLTHADAVAACSLSVTHKDKSRAKIIASARYAKHVAANTASTQSSSSINSLAALNVLTESRDEANHVCYSIADNDFTNALLAQI